MKRNNVTKKRSSNWWGMNMWYRGGKFIGYDTRGIYTPRMHYGVLWVNLFRLNLVETEYKFKPVKLKLIGDKVKRTKKTLQSKDNDIV